MPQKGYGGPLGSQTGGDLGSRCQRSWFVSVGSRSGEFGAIERPMVTPLFRDAQLNRPAVPPNRRFKHGLRFWRRQPHRSAAAAIGEASSLVVLARRQRPSRALTSGHQAGLAGLATRAKTAVERFNVNAARPLDAGGIFFRHVPPPNQRRNKFHRGARECQRAPSEPNATSRRGCGGGWDIPKRAMKFQKPATKKKKQKKTKKKKKKKKKSPSAQ